MKIKRDGAVYDLVCGGTWKFYRGITGWEKSKDSEQKVKRRLGSGAELRTLRCSHSGGLL